MADSEGLQFDPTTTRRILEAVFWYERAHRQTIWKGPGMGPPPTAGDSITWLRLTSDLAAGTPNSPTTASGKPVTWNGSGYDEGDAVTVKSYLGFFGYADTYIKYRTRTIGESEFCEAFSYGLKKTEVDVLSGVGVDGVNLTKTVKTIVVLEDDDSPTTSNYHTGTECPDEA